uniref:Uncharacterized protein n=1 Tax=Anguilla anguilla TaxID=7936 RepID=A0A0E9W999_ANGAN
MNMTGNKISCESHCFLLYGNGNININMSINKVQFPLHFRS